jgi:phage terminase large subunit-like protein
VNVATGGRRERLLAQVRAREALARRRVERPLDFVRWLRPQGEVLRHTSKRLLYRGGNQVAGKTTVGAAELIWRCLGKHPRKRVRQGPIIAVVVVSTAKQGRAIQRKVRALLPDAEVDWDLTQYNVKSGFGANEPTIVFKNGSLVRFLTTEQGAVVIQGDTLHYVWIDETCTPEVFRELERRVLMQNGDIILTLTPINRPAEWVAEKVEQGLLDEIHVRLTIDALTHEDGRLRTLEDGTVLDQAWIDEQRRIVPAQWAPIILDGEWRVIGLGAFFTAFDRAVHVSDTAQLDADQGQIRWHLGVDYATVDREGLVAILVKAQHFPETKESPGKQWIILEDCVVLPGISTIAQFIDEVVSMLQRNGLRWRDIKTAYGDNPVESKGAGGYKSNLDFMRRLAHRLQVAEDGLRPRLHNAKEGRASGGSVDAGLRYLHDLMVSHRLIVRNRALPVIEAFEQYIQGDKLQAAKDIVDAVRYSLKDYIESRDNPYSGVVLRLRR